MKVSKRQSGMSLLGLLTVAVMVGFFVMSAIRMAPSYIEYLTVRDVVQRVAEEFNREEDTVGDLRRKLATLLNTNQVYDVEARDIEIFREDGRMWIDAGYEVRIPVVWRIDAVLKFDDLKYEAGVSSGE